MILGWREAFRGLGFSDEFSPLVTMMRSAFHSIFAGHNHICSGYRLHKISFTHNLNIYVVLTEGVINPCIFYKLLLPNY